MDIELYPKKKSATFGNEVMNSDQSNIRRVFKQDLGSRKQSGESMEKKGSTNVVQDNPSSNSHIPEFLKQEEILDPDCIFMVIGAQEKMNIFLKTFN